MFRDPDSDSTTCLLCLKLGTEIQCISVFLTTQTFADVVFWHVTPLTSPAIKTQSSVFKETLGFP